MPGLNRVFFMGNLGADPEVRYTQNGTAVCTLRVACNEKWNKDGETQERVTWMRIVAWARIAENCGEYLHKGSPVLIEGRLQNRDWEDKEGVKRSVTEIVANTVTFLSTRGEGEGEGSGRREEPPGPEEDDIPF